MSDGIPLFVREGLLPSLRKPELIPKDPAFSGQIKEKINKIGVIRYIAGGQVLRLTYYFCVPTGESDIQIVYDLTVCGLNAAVWAPSFWMNTIHNFLGCASLVSCFGYIYAREMFCNYHLDRYIRPFAGVDVS